MKRFVTFEGGEGCGKTTQIGLAATWLAEQGVPSLTTAEPGGTPLGRKIREILLNRGPWSIGAEAELLLFAAARAQHVRETIQPALAEGKLVLCDRFADATLAYQGFGRGLDIGFIRELNDFSACSLTPDRTILLDVPVATGLTRAKKERPAFGRRLRRTVSSRRRWPFTAGYAKGISHWRPRNRSVLQS